MNLIFTSLLTNWRASQKGAKNSSLLAALLILTLPALITGCSGGDAAPAAGGSGEGGNITPTSEYEIIAFVSKNSILSDNKETATITATVSKNNVAQSGVTVTFSTTGGLLSSDTVVTDSFGEASTTITSGLRPSNQPVDMMATCLGASDTVQLGISGNTINLTVSQSNMAVGATQTLTALLQNASPIGIGWAPVSFSIVSGTSVSLGAATDDTDFNGEATIDISALSTGTTIIKASSLGAEAQITITVAAAAQVFEITSPTTDTTTIESNTGSVLVTVNAPTQTAVIFYTSIGSWNGGSNQLEVAVVGGLASATLTSTVAGNASVMVYDKAHMDTKDTLQVTIYAPASEAHHITLQASQTSLFMTPDGSTSPNTVTLTAKVYNVDNFAVGNAIVNFTLSNTTGSGENVLPPVAVTNTAGVATTTFYSGTAGSSGAGVTVTATLNSNNAINKSINIIIRDLAGSIALTRANKIVPSSDNTYYTQAISAQVSDSNGNPVPADTVISLKLWPVAYHLGAEVYLDGSCVGYSHNLWPDCDGSIDIDNEDTNENLILDLDPTSEDIGPYDMVSDSMEPDGFLTPPNSSAGSVPAMVLTDEKGMAHFEINYLKQYAMWVKVQLTANVEALGTEAQTKMEWTLDAEKSEFESCNLFPSPFGYFTQDCPLPPAP